MDLTPQSRFRHVFCPGLQPEDVYQGFRVAPTTGDQGYIDGNAKYFAIPSAGGGGPIAIRNHHTPGRMPPILPLLAGHKGDLCDVDFNPFCDEELISGAADCTVKFWRIPEGGLVDTQPDSLATLSGHRRKVTFVEFNPVADMIIASASADGFVKVWDLREEAELGSFECSQLPQDLHWNYNGSLFCVSTKDKLNRVFDPRSNKCAIEWSPHQGTKCAKFVWVGDSMRVVTTGFTKSSQREFRLWDLKNTSKPICGEQMDMSSGALLPFFDPDTNIIYIGGKGDGNIRYYEIKPDSFYPLSQYSTTVPARGMTLLPKKYCDVVKAEIACILKLTSKGDVEPLPFYVPRKVEGYSADLYPDTYAGIPGLSNDEWKEGKNSQPVLMGLEPGSSRIVYGSTSDNSNNGIPPLQLNRIGSKSNNNNNNMSSPMLSPTLSPTTPSYDSSKFSLAGAVHGPPYVPKSGKLGISDVEAEMKLVFERMEFLQNRLEELAAEPFEVIADE